LGQALLQPPLHQRQRFTIRLLFSPASHPSAESLPGCIYQSDKCNNHPAKSLIRLIALSGYACSQQKFNAIISRLSTGSDRNEPPIFQVGCINVCAFSFMIGGASLRGNDLNQ
jgi:hypothetical protein